MIQAWERVIWRNCEVPLPGPVSVDLRKRVVEAVDNGLTYADAATQFRVGAASVSRWLALFRRTGSVEPLPMGGSEPILGEDARAVLDWLVTSSPDATLEELVDQLDEELGVRVGLSTMSRTLRTMGYTRKKKRSSTTAGRTPTSSRSEPRSRKPK